MRLLALTVLIGALAIAASIVFIERWRFVPRGEFGVYRLDRWSGKVDFCSAVTPGVVTCAPPVQTTRGGLPPVNELFGNSTQ